VGNWREFQKGPGAKRARVQVGGWWWRGGERREERVCFAVVVVCVFVLVVFACTWRHINPKNTTPKNDTRTPQKTTHERRQAYSVEENVSGKKHGQHKKEEWRKSWK
jgi:hypothetical protein